MGFLKSLSNISDLLPPEPNLDLESNAPLTIEKSSLTKAQIGTSPKTLLESFQDYDMAPQTVPRREWPNSRCQAWIAIYLSYKLSLPLTITYLWAEKYHMDGDALFVFGRGDWRGVGIEEDGDKALWKRMKECKAREEEVRMERLRKRVRREELKREREVEERGMSEEDDGYVDFDGHIVVRI